MNRKLVLKPQTLRNLTTKTLSDASWVSLSERFDEPGLIELVILIGHYTMLAFALNALNVQPEEQH